MPLKAYSRKLVLLEWPQIANKFSVQLTFCVSVTYEIKWHLLTNTF